MPARREAPRVLGGHAAGGVLTAVDPALRAARLRLLVTAAVDALGTGLFYASSVFFYLRVVDLSPASLGASLGVAGLVGALASPVVGRLADRVPLRPLLTGSFVARALGYTALAFTHGAVAAGALLAVIGVSDRTASIARQIYVAGLGDRAFAVDLSASFRVFKNALYAVGALIASPFVASGSGVALRWCVVANGVSFGAGALVLRGLPRVRARRVRAADGALRMPGALRLRLTSLAVADGLLSFHATFLSLGYGLIATLSGRVPASVVPVVFVVNTVIVVVGQRPVTRAITARRLEPLGMAGAGALLAAALLLCTLAVTATHGAVAFCLVVAAAALHSMAELAESTGSWSLPLEIGEPFGVQGMAVSLFNLSVGLQASLAPAVVSLLLGASLVAGLPALAALFAVSGVLVMVLARSSLRLSRHALEVLERSPRDETRGGGTGRGSVM